MNFFIEINNSQVEVQEGETLLKVLRRNGIKVPTLCHMEKFSPTGACRLCVVEVEGKRDLITSCSYPVESNMKVFTNTQRVVRARKTIIEMLLSAHPDDCLYCIRNGNCELQELSEEMNVKERRFFAEKKPYFPDNSSPSVLRDPAKCVLCSRCVRVCDETQKVSALDFISRGNKTVVNSAFKKGLNVASCIHCGQCIIVCPTSALSEHSHIEQIQAALGNPKLQVLFLVSPVVTATLAEMYGLKPEKETGFLVSACLKKMGAHKVFDLGVANDLSIRMEAQLLAKNIENGVTQPLINSCCPGFVKFVEAFKPEYLSRLAPIRSPQQIFGRLLKTLYTKQRKVHPDVLFTVAVMPCVGNKFEAARQEMTYRGVSEIDAVLTTREFLRMVRSFGLDVKMAEPVPFDQPFESSSQASYKMGYSGGKAESVAAALAEILNTAQQEPFKLQPVKSAGGIKEAKLILDNAAYGFAWVSGMANAYSFLDQLSQENRQDVHYIEIMACQHGCIGGGGQPLAFGLDKYKSRKKVCQEFEKSCNNQKPGQKAAVQELMKFAETADLPEYFQTHFGQQKG
ncbi:MAG TPA: [Fe-Fe] hydrogenase large subunit C-terminal domain-containing protein [Bacteroidales bacterium]|nr:[Fe-Fe] hydrogenase large subunit C-terminal domain-containing protein [Bacteroidales bacterium]